MNTIPDDMNDDHLIGLDIPENDVNILPDVAQAQLKVTPTFLNIKYAPVIPTVKGHYVLYCLVIRWLDNPGENMNSAEGACKQAAQVWRQLSNSLLTFDVIAKEVKVNLTHNPKNLNDAERMAKASVDDTKPHTYVIFNNGLGNVSHGHGDTAHLIGTLTRDVLHEMGHCNPTDLGHSGKYDSNGKLLPYDDGTSFMGRFASDKLTGAQLYLLGWMAQNQVGQYDIGDNPTDFNVQHLYGAGSNLRLILIPRGNQRPLYLSYPQVNGKAALCLHLSAGRGTQRVAVFGNHAVYEDLQFDKIADNGSYVTVRMSTI